MSLDFLYVYASRLWLFNSDTQHNGANILNKYLRLEVDFHGDIFLTRVISVCTFQGIDCCNPSIIN